jgi:serine-type D-Ala-D-Ala carboxypeptidase/endopeptidase
MKQIATCVALLSLLLAAASADDSPAWKTKADTLVKPLLESKKLHNVIIGVVDATGNRHYITFGDKPDGVEKFDETTIFEIGSITKVFTSLALADAVTKGELKLEDPVKKYLPKTITLPRRGQDDITLEELATHTSGLPRIPNNMMKAKGFSGKNPYAAYDERLLAEALKEVKFADPAQKPKLDYSNLGVGLLGLTLARQSGKTFEAMMRARVLEPLGMKDTCIKLNSADKKRLIPCFIAGGGPGNTWEFQDTIAGAGALRSTAADMLTFLECEMGRRETPLRKAMDLTQSPRKEMTKNMSIGLGWFTFTAGAAKRRVWWHNGGTGGFSSFAAFSKDPSVGIIVLSNRSSPGDSDKVGMELIKLLAEGK